MAGVILQIEETSAKHGRAPAKTEVWDVAVTKDSPTKGAES